MHPPVKHCYEFGPFRVDADKRLLYRDGEVVPLTARVFDVLLVFITNSGRTLTKEELMEEVWLGDFVEEGNLTRNVSTLRKALGESPDDHHYLVTIPGRGYRFVAEVREATDEERQNLRSNVMGNGVGESIEAAAAALDRAAVLDGEAVAAADRSRKRWRGPVIALPILLLVGVGAALSFWPVARHPVAPSVDIKSIAVLPLRPLQASERDEALEMGTTSILINRLGSLRQVIVRPESAVERYARPGQDPLDAGREQKVDAVLDSRYQRSGDKYRFTLSLLRVADGATLWADTLDQQAADLFAIQDALSTKVTDALRLTLSDAEKELLAKHYSNTEAWMLYVRGRHLLHQRRIPDIEKSITYFQRAIALDHGFAPAHVMLGYSYASLSNFGYAPPKKLLPKAKAAYDQALKIDDQLAEVHAYLANYKMVYEWDYGGAEQEHRRAIDLNPNSADVHILYALYLKNMGRFEQAIAESRRAEALDPTDMFINLSASNILYFARRYDEAIEQASRGGDLNPNWGPGYGWMIRAYEMMGDEQRAFATYLKQAEANSVGPDEISGMKAAFAAGGLKDHWRRMLDRLLEREKSGYVQQLNVALLYARLGEKEQALARLQKAVDDRDILVCALNVEPLWDSYRTDPRFVKLVRRVGLAR